MTASCRLLTDAGTPPTDLLSHQANPPNHHETDINKTGIPEQLTLDEEGETNKKLTKLATSSVNRQAATV